MEPVVIAVLIGISVYMALIALIPERILADSSRYTRSMIEKLARKRDEETEENISVLRQQTRSSGFLARVFFTLPGANAVYPKLLKAGLANRVGRFFAACIAVMLIASYGLKQFGGIGIIIAFVLAYVFGAYYIKFRIDKRNAAFINFFPDALDMIVRSVRSGYPLSSAVRMVADNMEAPVSTEFKQVADEVAYGSTLIEALSRLCLRIDEPDVRFFVVVLTVQQDVGGNLSEVLNNLSGIIRKRKHLRMKIKALSSEGRATAWVLGTLPFCEAGLIMLAYPQHLTPLFTTPLGHMALALTLGSVAIGVIIARKIVNIKV